MKSLNRAMLIAVLVLVAIVSAACGGGGSGGGSGKPEDAAKAFIEATFKGDFTALKNAVCDKLKGDLTAEAEATIKAGLDQMGGAGSLDTSAITYTYDSANKVVTLGGTMKATVQGVSMDIPVDTMFATGLPVVEEGGGWKVCPETVLGG